MNHTIYILIAFICIVSCGSHPNAVNAVEAPRGFHKIGNKTLIEYIEKFDQKFGQGPEFADRGIAIYCDSYLGSLGADSLRYSITYNAINSLLPPFYFV